MTQSVLQPFGQTQLPSSSPSQLFCWASHQDQFFCQCTKKFQWPFLVVTNGLKPNQVSTDVASRSLCEAGRIDHAVELSSFGIKPDLVTCTILIDNVCNSKNLREAMRLLSEGSEAIGVYKKMKEEGVELDLVTYNTSIFGLSKSGRVLDIMVESGKFPDAVTYTSLMNGMCRAGNALGAVVLLKEMERKGCSPNSCTYNTLLHGFCKCRLMEKGMELYGAMKSAGMKLEIASYATLVRALCRCKCIIVCMCT
ncbi:hypothetical protein CRYUN_Cryun24cG0002700 [Craigia yunnanensis]